LFVPVLASLPPQAETITPSDKRSIFFIVFTLRKEEDELQNDSPEGRLESQN
jgi:hypothetical protein